MALGPPDFGNGGRDGRPEPRNTFLLRGSFRSSHFKLIRASSEHLLRGFMQQLELDSSAIVCEVHLLGL